MPSYGNLWTWVAMCRDTKLVVSGLVGERGYAEARAPMLDLAGRVKHKIQITTDGFEEYGPAVLEAFPVGSDYAILIKDFGKTRKVRYVDGRPDLEHISTSIVERQNLTLREQLRRLRRKTAGHSKKAANHAQMLAIFYHYYNFAKPHESLYRVSPAQAAGLTRRLWTVRTMIRLLKDQERLR